MVHAVALASSSVSLSVVVPPPGVIDAIDNSIREELQSNSHAFFMWVLVSAIVVAVGVAMEGPEILHEMWPNLFLWFTGPSKDCIAKFERAIKRVGLVGWLLVVIGVIGEGMFEGLQNRAEGQLQTFNDVLLRDARLTATSAENSAQGAADASSRARDESDKAVTSSTQAMTLASGARKEADSFEADIVSAKKQAAEAESHLAEALKQAADARRELYLLRSPRLLTNASEFVNNLRQFSGTKYTFTLVAQDTDSVQLLRQIDSALQLAGWTRVKPDPAPTIGAPFDDFEKGFMIGLGTQDGVQVEVDSAESISELRSTNPDNWPTLVRAASILRNALAGLITPVEGNVQKSLVVKPGNSPAIRISVGSKVIISTSAANQ